MACRLPGARDTSLLRALPRPLRRELRRVRLRHGAVVRQPPEDVDAAAALTGLDGLDRALHRQPALRRRLLYDRAVPRARTDGLQPDAAAAVADQRHLLAVQGLLRAGRALVGADRDVEVRVRLHL